MIGMQYAGVMATPAQRRRAARHQQPLGDDPAQTRRGPSAGRKKPITVDAIVDTAFGIIERDGFDALTMRRVAAALETGPASLYAHVVNKNDLDDLLIGRLCSEIVIPPADPDNWREQLTDICASLRDQFLRYPGISRAALAMVPTNTETLRISEGMLSVLLAGGIDAQTAAWTMDALLLYINAFCLETSMVGRQIDSEEWVIGRDDMRNRLAELSDDFPNTKTHATQTTSGTPRQRFDFTLELMLRGLAS